MHRLFPAGVAAATGLAIAAAAGIGGAPAAVAAGHHYAYAHSCTTTPKPHHAACNAILRQNLGATGSSRAASANLTPSGFGPSSLQSAYALAAAAASQGTTQTVGIVDAYDDPNAASDLATYRSTFGLPPCPVGSCFRKVSQTGSTTSLPRRNGGWAEEESLDLDMVSAICPNCKILLVEATSASLANLGAAVNEAVKLGATEVSNSYGGSESRTDTSYDTTYYKHPGVPITASTGDNGYGVSYPAASPYVTAVGGTSLAPAANTRQWSETAWSDAGSGCSAYDAQPTWQASVVELHAACAKRALADVSAVGDPNTGVAVYDSYSYQGYSGWLVFGGTSVSSPIIASVYALAGNGSTINDSRTPYSDTADLNDVVSGSNGSCGGSRLCTSTSGWDGPTGLGTPNGTGAF